MKWQAKSSSMQSQEIRIGNLGRKEDRAGIGQHVNVEVKFQVSRNTTKPRTSSVAESSTEQVYRSRQVQRIIPLSILGAFPYRKSFLWWRQWRWIQRRRRRTGKMLEQKTWMMIPDIRGGGLEEARMLLGPQNTVRDQGETKRRTAFEDAYGHPYKSPIVPFGEVVLFKMLFNLVAGQLRRGSWQETSHRKRVWLLERKTSQTNPYTGYTKWGAQCQDGGETSRGLEEFKNWCAGQHQGPGEFLQTRYADIDSQAWQASLRRRSPWRGSGRSRARTWSSQASLHGEKEQRETKETTKKVRVEEAEELQVHAWMIQWKTYGRWTYHGQSTKRTKDWDGERHRARMEKEKRRSCRDMKARSNPKKAKVGDQYVGALYSPTVEDEEIEIYETLLRRRRGGRGRRTRREHTNHTRGGRSCGAGQDGQVQLQHLRRGEERRRLRKDPRQYFCGDKKAYQGSESKILPQRVQALNVERWCRCSGDRISHIKV